MRARQSQWMVVCGALVVSLAAAPAAGNDAPSLIDAVKAQDRVAVRALLKDRGALAAVDADGTTALHWAVRGDDLETARLLLAAGIDPSAATRYGITPLALAAANGSLELTRLLLEAGADPDATLPEGETVLMTAARTGRGEVVEALIAGGADVGARESWYGETALMWAAAENHPDAIRALVAGGADINARSHLLEVRRRRTGQSVLPLGHWTPLMYAARQNAVAAIKTLATLGADLDLTDPDGATALVLAIINAHYDAAAALVERGASPNIADTEAQMAALYAAVDMNRLAVGHGRPNTKASGQLSAADLVKLLLAHGADPNARLKAPLMQRHHTGGDRALGEGSTPFMRAAKSGDVEVMRLLLQGGADPTLTQPNQVNALMLAAGLGWRDGSPAAPAFDQGSEQEAVEAIKLCLEAGLDINATTNTGETALHAAVTGRGAEPIVKFLIEAGADLTAKNKQGRTPLEALTSSRRERPDLVALLKERMAQ